ncbi:MAG: hypothetical protein J0I06_00605 [Planctomycetes bacterium]|nr:hypothetical protein [Planctomycetota bacterium]
MAESGRLADPQRHFGVDAPRGARWYNFDPCAFLECASAGTFGGRRGDDHGAEPLAAISWEEFRDFLRAGQEYG